MSAQGGEYGHGVVTAAKASLEGDFAEIGTGTLNEALTLRAAGVSAPVNLCFQPDIQSAPAVAHAPDVQARPKHWQHMASCSVIQNHPLHFQEYDYQNGHDWPQLTDPTAFLMQVYVEDTAFVEALCKAATIQNRTVPVAVHVTVSTGAVSVI